MKATRNMIAGIALLMSATSAISQEAINRTILGVDKSGSSTFLYERHSADAAANYVYDYITDLTPPHDLLMISVGDTGMAERDIHIRASVAERRASSPRRMAEQFGGYFRALPQLISEGAIAPDDTTSLVEFFQSLEDICSEAPTRIILFSDAVEWSTTVDGRAFLNGTASLPTPSSSFLSGCHVEIHGVGQLREGLASDGLERRLKPIWRSWLTEAGAESVRLTGSFTRF